MADKGFTIGKFLAERRVTYNIPAFLRGKRIFNSLKLWTQTNRKASNSRLPFI